MTEGVPQTAMVSAASVHRWRARWAPWRVATSRCTSDPSRAVAEMLEYGEGDENILRRLDSGDVPAEAAVNGRAEIGMAALAITSPLNR